MRRRVGSVNRLGDASSTFIPWLSISPGTGVLQTSQDMADTQRDWKLGYLVFYSGISRLQTEALADRMRLALTTIAREDVDTDTGTWKIQKVGCQAIGNTSRIASGYPDYFTQSDSFEVWVTKGT